MKIVKIIEKYPLIKKNRRLLINIKIDNYFFLFSVHLDADGISPDTSQDERNIYLDASVLAPTIVSIIIVLLAMIGVAICLKFSKYIKKYRTFHLF